MRRIFLVGLWVVATAATTAIAYVAVNAAGAGVTDRPLTSVVATDVPSTTTVSFSTSSTPSTTLGTPTTATTGAPSSTATTTTADPASTTTTTAPDWQQTTINSIGGSVIVSYRPGEVRLESVVPQPGFLYEIDETGPPEVRVGFEAGHIRVEVRAKWDGGLLTEVNEES